MQTKALVDGKHSKYKGFHDRAEALYFSRTGNIPKSSSESYGYRPPLAPTGYHQQRTAPPPVHTYTALTHPHHHVKTEPQSSRSNDVVRQPVGNARELDGESLQDVEDGLAKYYAVAYGRKPGLYESWFGADGAREQTNGFSGAVFKGFDDREEAIEFMRVNGIARSDIRVFREAFRKSTNFEPKPTASFNDEFKRFAASQRMDRPAMNKAKVDAIRDSLIHFCLPGGLTVDQEDPDEGIILTLVQTLEIYKTMCRLAGKTVQGRINHCLRELNAAPYVNIIDFIDNYRTQQRIRTFQNWSAFKHYTLDGRTINVEYASKNEFLAPLLQDFGRGPGAVNPMTQRDRLIRERDGRIRDREAKKALEKREREERERAMKHHVMSAISEERSLSPSPSEFSQSPSQSRSPTPELESSTPDSVYGEEDDQDYIKHEPPSPAPIRTPANNIKQEYELPEFPSSQQPPASSQMEERHWTQATQPSKRAHDSEMQDPAPRKRKRGTELEMLNV